MMQLRSSKTQMTWLNSLAVQCGLHEIVFQKYLHSSYNLLINKMTLFISLASYMQQARKVQLINSSLMIIGLFWYYYNPKHVELQFGRVEVVKARQCKIVRVSINSVLAGWRSGIALGSQLKGRRIETSLCYIFIQQQIKHKHTSFYLLTNVIMIIQLNQYVRQSEFHYILKIKDMINPYQSINKWDSLLVFCCISIKQFAIQLYSISRFDSIVLINIFKNIVLIFMDNPQISSNSHNQPSQLEVAGFIGKTFQILNNDQFSKIIYWAASGTEFVIKDVNKFQQIVLSRYFRHNKINSFVRQLNMYGFHKSRGDHSKSVFSHPAFLKDRQDLLITIQRKIKIKLETQYTQQLSTPTKPQTYVSSQNTSVKKQTETGNDLRSTRNVQYPQAVNQPSFNLLVSKQNLNSMRNFNYTVKNIPQLEMDESYILDCEQQDGVSIQDQIEQKMQEANEDNKQIGQSLFMNPSCFFQSMKRQSDV